MDRPTPESVSQARHQMWEERAAIERQIGRLISAEGRILKFPSPSPFTVCCAKCRFEAEGQTLGQAIRVISRHVLSKHDPRRSA